MLLLPPPHTLPLRHPLLVMPCISRVYLASQAKLKLKRQARQELAWQ